VSPQGAGLALTRQRQQYNTSPADAKTPAGFLYFVLPLRLSTSGETMTTVITIANHKGGVGKTTTAVSVAHGLTLRGKEVLLIDLDPQGQSAVSLGLKSEPGTYYLLTPPPGGVMTARDWIRCAREHLWLLPGDVSTNASQAQLNASGSPINHIAEQLKPFTKSSDLKLEYIIFDTAPSVGGIQERAIWASDLVLVPAATEFLAADGVKKIFDLMVKMQRDMQWTGKFAGLLPTFYDGKTGESRVQLEEYQRTFRESTLPPIHRATALRECPGLGLTIFEMEYSIAVARAVDEYETVVNYILKVK
jgi:chromosome partitioning protein